MKSFLLTIFSLLLIGLLAQRATAQEFSDATTGDPWKVLVLVYLQTDVTYVDVDDVTKHLTATMPASDATAMINAFLNQPHRGVVYDYSDQTAEMEAHIVYSPRPLTHVSEVGGPYSYWPDPEDTHIEIDQYAPEGMYDSVIIFWQASDPVTGQSIPSGGWGWGGWMGIHNMTYATVYNLSWYWPGDPCKGEVFLHEWLHGVTGFYQWLGFPFPVEDLHGAEEAGYTQDQNGCWETWLRDYLRGLVLENGQYKGLVPAAWQRGSITTYNIQGWRGEYYNNDALSDLPIVVRDDSAINFEWQDTSPHPLLHVDHFSARWKRQILFENYSYEFNIFHDDGVRLFVDGEKKFENWCIDCSQTDMVTLPMTAGNHTIEMQMWENQGWAAASLSWKFADSLLPGGSVLLPTTDGRIEPGPVDFTAEAWDNPGGAGVDRVEFFVFYSGSWHPVFTDNTAPFGFVWTAPDGLPDQLMDFTIHVYDRAGNVTIDPGGYRSIPYAECKNCNLILSGWPVWRGNLEKNGRSLYPAPQKPRLDWTLFGNVEGGTAPVVGPDGIIYVAQGNRFKAIRPDGSTAWSYTAGKKFTSSAALTTNGKVFLTNEDGKLYAFSTTGALVWTYPTDGWTISAPVVGQDGVIYFGSSDNMLRALTPNGKLKWIFPAWSWINSSPALGQDGTIYFGSTDYQLRALNKNGSLKWIFDTGAFVDGSPVIGPSGSVYIVTVNGKLFSLNPANGVKAWEYQLPCDVGGASPAVGSDGTVYMACNDRTPENGFQEAGLYAIGSNGSLKWKYSLAANPNSSPSLDANDDIFVSVDDGALYALSPNGTLKWKLILSPGLRLYNNPVIASFGTIYVHSSWPSAYLFAIKEAIDNSIFIPSVWK